LEHGYFKLYLSLALCSKLFWKMGHIVLYAALGTSNQSFQLFVFSSPSLPLDVQDEEDVDVRSKARVWDGEMSDSDSEDENLREPKRRNRQSSEPAFPRYDLTDSFCFMFNWVFYCL
jgi:hypothetical protein